MLSLGMQGIESQEIDQRLMGVAIPGSSRAKYIQYSYRAKLGFDGKDIKISQKGEKSYAATIPEFIFIGMDKVEFKVAVESSGLLSFITPELDTAKMINDLLTQDAKQEHIRANRDLLEDQTRSFYTGIVKSIDPNATVEFEFTRS
ncbi:MAG: hypothetical protein ACRDAX_03305 [Propionibacteriaceae bacterium]